MNRKIRNIILTYLVITFLVSILLIFAFNLIGYFVNRSGHEISSFMSLSYFYFIQFLISFTALLNLVKVIRDNMFVRLLFFNLSSIISLIIIIFLSKGNSTTFIGYFAALLPYMLCLMIASVRFTLFIIELKKAYSRQGQ